MSKAHATKRTSGVLDTRTALLMAAKDVVREKGFAGFSTRDVAAMAGVPLSQIHYYFGSKRALVIAMFEHSNDQLLERQNALFEDPEMLLSQQWATACDYLDADLESGYVRVLLELWAAGWSEPEVAEVVRTAISGGNALLNDIAHRAEARFGGLEPFSADEIATLVSTAFIGGEAFLLLDLEREKFPVRSALRRVGEAIKMLEENHEEGG